jgi:hypothetical protein
MTPDNYLNNLINENLVLSRPKLAKSKISQNQLFVEN